MKKQLASPKQIDSRSLVQRETLVILSDAELSPPRGGVELADRGDGTRLEASTHICTYSIEKDAR